MLVLKSESFKSLTRSISLKFKFRNPKSISASALRVICYAFVGWFFVLCALPLPIANAAQVTLAWDASSGEVAGYIVYYGRASRNYQYHVDVHNNTSCTISGLDEGTTYYFAATAYNTNSVESSFSSELAYTTPAQTPPPSPADSPTEPPSPDLSTTPSVPELETGKLQIDHNWVRVTFNKAFGDPVVVANPLSINGADPAVIRIRNVDSNGFDMRVQEYEYLDGNHTLEMASYLVMERGNYTLADGTRIEADTFETNNVRSFEAQSFNQVFQEAPVVISSIASFNESDAATGRLRSIDLYGFEYCMQEQESNSDGHATESINYIAWEPSSGVLNGYPFEVQKTADVIDHNFHRIQFSQSFADIPVMLADMQTADGTDTAGIRWQNLNTAMVDVQVSEEQASDSEVNHTTEIVGYIALAFEQSDIISIPNEPPIARCAADPSSGVAPLELSFDASASADLDGTIVLYEWDFDGDGIYDWSSPNTGNTTYRYDTPNTYRAVLRVTDNDNASDTAAVTITVTSDSNNNGLSDSDNDGLSDTDEINIYGTDPDKSDTDKDGINDGDELTYWGENWDLDYDGDGKINLLDRDSDKDHLPDGWEINQGGRYDPADRYNRP